MSDGVVEKRLKKLAPLVDAGNYKAALALVKPLLREFPDHFQLRYQYAKILGDWADELPLAQKRKYKAESISILKPLMAELRGHDVATRFSLSLNFYYQSEDWPGMYAFGQRFARVDRQRSLYAKGLSATLLSFDLRKTKKAESRSWAKKAVRAWRSYDLASARYYFPHYSFAKALALNGESGEALRRLQTAAKLGKRPVTDWEFADVRELIAVED